MELIKSAGSRYEEYEALLTERDQVMKDADSIWISYIQEFGQLISDVYEKQLECIKRKKILSYCQAAINHGDIIRPEALQEWLDREMASYETNLRKMLDDNKRCRDAKTSTAYEVKRSKELYRRLVKLLHPDINPETDRESKLRELWGRIVSAYRINDVKELSELEVLTRKALAELGAGKIRIDIPDIDDRIDALKKEIHEITHTEPYILGELLKNPEDIGKKKKELEEQLNSYHKYRNQLDAEINKMIADEGITIQWLMK